MTRMPLIKTVNPPTKIIVLLTLFITIGCILATGCIGQIKKDNGSENASISPTNTFSPIVNNTDFPGPNVTAKSGLMGPLRVSIGSYQTDQPLPVLIDNLTVGVVSVGVPLDLMVDEGNHSVAVCVGVICPEKYVNITFAKRLTLEFDDILKIKAEFSKPTVRILQAYKFGNGVSVDVEFINPTQKDLAMSAEVSVGYTYIDYRTSVRMGDSVRSKVSEMVEAGRRVTRTVDLYFSDGSAYNYDAPKLGEITQE